MFAKVFSQILDSSLAEDYRVRLVFEDFLKLADKEGVVDMTVESIARRTNVPIEIVSMGIAALEKPDPVSRTPDMDGRRIVLMDSHRSWGWRIVNFKKYRESATKEMLRMGEADRKREARRRKGFPPSPLSQKKEGEAEADMSASVPPTSGHVRTITAHPSLKEAIEFGNMRGIPEREVTAFWNHFEASGWIDRNGNPVAKWTNKLATWWAKSQNDKAEKNHHNGYTKPTGPSIEEQELARIQRMTERL